MNCSIDINMPPEEKRRYKLVRTDSMTDIAVGAEIVSADAGTGRFCLLIPKLDEHGRPVFVGDRPVLEATTFDGPPGGFAIVRR